MRSDMHKTSHVDIVPHHLHIKAKSDASMTDCAEELISFFLLLFVLKIVRVSSFQEASALCSG